MESMKWRSTKLTEKKREFISWRPDAAERIKRLEEETLNFFKDEQIGWFRGLSFEQLKACDNILFALRDDMRQKTTFRIRQCVHDLGVLPMVSDKHLALLRDMSRGNDIAFLWFLMDSFYSPKINICNGLTYNISEQTIMTGIAHLDIIPTWRELDRMLPPVQPTKKEIMKLRKEAERKKVLEEKARISSKRRAAAQRKALETGKVVSPYLQKLVRFKGISRNYSKNNQPEFTINLKRYKRWEDPFYKVPNQNTRWYKDYTLDPAKRIATKIISDQLKDVVEKGRRPRKITLPDKLRRSIVKSLFVIREVQSGASVVQSNMHIHNPPFSAEASLNKSKAPTDEEIVKKRQECIDYLLGPDKKKEHGRQCILKQLDNDVEKFRQTLSKSTPKTNSTLVMQIRDKEDYSVVDVDTNKYNCRQKHNARHCIPLKCGAVKKNEKDMGFKGRFAQFGEFGDSCHHGMDGKETPVKKKTKRIKKNCPARIKDYSLDSEEEVYTEYEEYKIADDSLESEEHKVRPEYKPKPKAEKHCRTFFEAPTSHAPYRFNYDEIFNVDYQTDDNLNDSCKFRTFDAKAAMKQALLDDHAKVEENVGQCSDHMDLEAAASVCAHKIIAEFSQQSRRQTIAVDSTTSFHLKYNKDYYDPEDDALIQEMLKDALAVMRKDRKFTLATFPDAHKLEALRYWVATRFGRTFSLEERLKRLQHSQKLFNRVIKHPKTLPFPWHLDLSKPISYNLLQCFLNEAKYTKRNYWKRTYEATLANVRELWCFSRPYMGTTGPPRQLFFAYLPASKRALTHYKVWNPHDFKDFVALRHKVNTLH